MSGDDSKKNRVSNAIYQAEQELAEKGPGQAIRDDMAELKAGIKRALSRDEVEPTSHGDDPAAR